MKLPDDNLLFIFEMANNHMGSVEHGLKIIREFHAIRKNFNFYFGFKFQYRHLETFIHPDYKSRYDFKYVKRFNETRLSKEQFLVLKNDLKKLNFISICTPFDEMSVDLIEEQGIDIIKIASCSFTDWPLLERIVCTDKPIIASTAGATLEDIDKVVSFFEHRNRDFALMHCVARYPTENNYLMLNQIKLLRQRYPEIHIGYSTHEHPDNIDSVKIAIALGATIFEKHVGLPTDNFKLNAYSATPSQVQLWLQSAQKTVEMCGVDGKRSNFTKEEKASLYTLSRGVFARQSLKKGQKITNDQIFLAIPVSDGQITANDLSKYTEIYANKDFDVNEPILSNHVAKIDIRERVYQIVQQVKELLKKSKVVLPGQADFEISHHYGIDRFYEFGITMITVVNREYCKKLIIMLPGQSHPEQHHKIKEETFHILYGTILINLDGIEKEFNQGDVIIIEKGKKHSFKSKTGAVIEEISSRHDKNDSYYTDSNITNNLNRKTLLTYWMD